MTRFPDLTRPLTVCSSTCHPVCLGLAIWIFKLFSENVGERVLISDHITQWDIRIWLLGGILHSGEVLMENQLLSAGCASPVQLYHTSDKCHNERKFMVMFLWCEALRDEGIRIFHPASTPSFAKLHSIRFCKPRSFSSHEPLWVAGIYSEEPGSESRHIFGISGFHGWGGRVMGS